MPGYGCILNPHRQSNPFTPTNKPIWLERATDKVSRDMNRTLMASELGTSPEDGVPPRLSYVVTAHQSRRDVGASDVIGDEKRPLVPSTLMTLPHQTACDKARSRAPSIPRKPAPLTSKSGSPSNTRIVEDIFLQKRGPVRSPVSSTSARSTSSSSLGVVPNPPTLQQTGDPRGIQSLSLPVASSMQAINIREPLESYVSDAPALPPRSRGSKDNLMDEIDSQVGTMDAWKPLQPH